jgi:hypothetical protein
MEWKSPVEEPWKTTAFQNKMSYITTCYVLSRYLNVRPRIHVTPGTQLHGRMFFRTLKNQMII